jgi:hypothetical protein
LMREVGHFTYISTPTIALLCKNLSNDYIGLNL